jgi:uncharacterized protein (TIGR03435 family)
MHRPSTLIALLALLNFVAPARPQSAQSKAATSTFEVISVRPSEHEVGPDYNNQITSLPGEFTGRNVTLKRLIAEAWRRQMSQVIGPSWLERNEYDISARLPEGATNDQIPTMLRGLLVDRFGLKEHDETRQMRVYELTVAPGGPHIHPVQPGAVTEGEGGGGFHFHGDMRQLADLLTIQFSIPTPANPTEPVRAGGTPIPVIDKTGLQGTYDFSVGFKPELGTDMFTSWKRALADELGLKIDSRKGDVPVVVVDDAAKMPTAN